MILGRNTQQWLGLISATLSFVQLLIGVMAPELADKSAIVLGGLGILLGSFVAFVANTHTTPVADPQLKEGTMVRVTDAGGTVVDHRTV